MGRQYTGKQITRTAEVKQKNGDVYVYERVYQYDRDKKKTVVVSNRLIEKRRAGEAAKEDAPAAPAAPQALLPPGRTEQKEAPQAVLTAAELRDFAEEHSCIREAAELCLPDAVREPLLSGLWRLALSRERSGEPEVSAAEEAELAELVAGVRGVLETLLRLRLVRCQDREVSLLALSGEPGRLFFRSGAELLGEQTLPEMLCAPAAVEKVWSSVGAGELLLQRTYIDHPIRTLEEMRNLIGRPLSFVCPLSLDFAVAERLLTETAVARRQSAQTLEDGRAVAATFGLAFGDTVELVSAAGSELCLHIYSFPRIREVEMARLEAQLDHLRELLETGTPAADLDGRAQQLCRRFLHQDERGRWQTDPESFRASTAKLGCLMLIANGTRDAAQALRLHEEADTCRRWVRVLAAEKKSFAVELLVRMLLGSVRVLTDAARGMEPPADASPETRLVTEAAAAYLENASGGELLDMLLGPRPSSQAAASRRLAVSELLRRAAANMKIAPVC